MVACSHHKMAIMHSKNPSESVYTHIFFKYQAVSAFAETVLS